MQCRALSRLLLISDYTCPKKIILEHLNKLSLNDNTWVLPVCFVCGCWGFLRIWFHFPHFTDSEGEWELGNTCLGVGVGRERERRDNFHFQKGWGVETQIAAALPEHPVWYSIGLHMLFSPGHAGLQLMKCMMSGVWFAWTFIFILLRFLISHEDMFIVP